jgi:hypothetical protein
MIGKYAPSTRQKYNPSLDGTVTTPFASAAYRMGHSLIGCKFMTVDTQNNKNTIELIDGFANRVDLTKDDKFNSFLRGLLQNKAMELDLAIEDSMRIQLFGTPGQAFFLDLMALDIQRGRDHGVPNYWSLRQLYPRSRDSAHSLASRSWASVTQNLALRWKLERYYGEEIPDDLDLLVGLFLEDDLPTSQHGPLATTILKQEFTRLRDADHCWYRKVFSGRLLQDIERVRLADIIEANTNGAVRVSGSAFHVPGCSVPSRHRFSALDEDK